MATILLVEDDRSIVENLRAFLQREGFAVAAAGGQREALDMVREGRYDLLLLDLSLPDGDGYAVCRAVKERAGTPVIFLTASGDEHSVVNGFEAGGDDYVAKPFRPRELVSRIQNVLRRAAGPLRCGDVSLDPARGVAFRSGRELALSALEYRLLLLFLTNRGAVLSRGRLLEELWDLGGDYVNDNTLTVYVKRLREKIEDDPQNPALLKTVRGLGYRMGEGT